MGLITKTVKIKWSSSNKKHYEGLGYKYTKIHDEFEVKVEDLMKNSHVEVECICDNCKKLLPSWKYQNYNRYKKENGETYCQKCAMELYGRENNIKNKINNGKTITFYDWCIENNRQDVLDRWDYELNGCSPKDILYKSKKKYWFKCNKHRNHYSELKNIGNFTNGHKGCVDCKQCNSIAQWFIDNNLDINNYWDYDKNIVTPWEVSKGNDKNKIWIKCQEKDYHGSYEIRCNDFIKGVRCSYCASKKVHIKDSIGQYIIDKYNEDFLWKVWADKNEKSPFEISFGSNKKYWWNCLDGKHEPFQRSCNSSIRYNFRCPDCVKEREESIYQEKTRVYLEEVGYKVLTEHDCTIRPTNPKTSHPLPFDNEIILENGKHLIIEVHGEQHYTLQSKNSKYLKKGQTPKEYLHERKLLDRYKRIKCIQAGYEYLEIPYTAFNKDDTYKKLINNKIKEILES